MSNPPDTVETILQTLVKEVSGNQDDLVAGKWGYSDARIADDKSIAKAKAALTAHIRAICEEAERRGLEKAFASFDRLLDKTELTRSMDSTIRNQFRLQLRKRLNSSKGGIIGGKISPTNFANNKELASMAGAKSKRQSIDSIIDKWGK